MSTPSVRTLLPDRTCLVTSQVAKHEKDHLLNRKAFPVPLCRLAYDGSDNGPAEGRTVYCYDLNTVALGYSGTVRALAACSHRGAGQNYCVRCL